MPVAVKNRLFFKIGLSYAILQAISLLGAFFFLHTMAKNLMIDQQKLIQKRAVAHLSERAERIVDGMEKLMMLIYHNGREGGVSLLEQINDPSYGEREIRGVMENLIKLHPEIRDFIVLNRRGEVFHALKPPRSLSLSYDFNERADIFPDGEGRGFSLSYRNSDYIAGSDSALITAGGRLFRLGEGHKKLASGAFLISTDYDALSARIADSASGGLSTLLIVNEEGRVLFESGGRYLGETHPAFRDHGGDLSRWLGEPLIIDKYSQNHFQVIAYTSLRSLLAGIDQKLMSYRIFVSLVLILSILIGLGLSFHFSSRIRNLLRMIQQIEAGRWEVENSDGGSDEMGELSRSLAQMGRNLGELVQKKYIAEANTKRAELEALQTKVNPHFLFNAIEGIRMTAIVNRDDQVAELLSDLGRFYRYMIRQKGKWARVEEELEYAASYLNIQKIRFAERLVFSLEAGEECFSYALPKLCLQPLIENSIKHGFEKKDGLCRLSVSVVKKGGFLVLRVEDNGVGLDEEARLRIEAGAREGIGLGNLSERIRHLFGTEDFLSIEEGAEGGLAVGLTLPAKPYREAVRRA